MKLDKIWIVTQPTTDSSTIDIAFSIRNVASLASQIRGGLDPEEVDSLWSTPEEAVTRAQELLDARDADSLAEMNARAK